jgi:hypothetical protein
LDKPAKTSSCVYDRDLAAWYWNQCTEWIQSKKLALSLEDIKEENIM